MEKYWTTASGEKIKYKDLTCSHLINILVWISRKADEGIKMETCTNSWDPDDSDVYIEELKGQEVLDEFDYKGLLKEAKRRGLGQARHILGIYNSKGGVKNMAIVKKCDRCRKVVEEDDSNDTNSGISLSKNKPLTVGGQDIQVEVMVRTVCGMNYDLCDTCTGKIIISYVKEAFGLK